jgi:hypothetical protein
MACLPQSGGCEKPLTDMFASHLNDTQRTQYVHHACLDVVDRKTPQPESLYVDSETKLRLVVERKCILWPIDYAQKHKNDHLVATIFSQLLEGPLDDGLYELSLPVLIGGTQRELTSLVLNAAQQILSKLPKVKAGESLRHRVNEQWQWKIRKVSPWDIEDGEPSKGLKVSFITPHSIWFESIDATNLPAELLTALQRIYSSCVKKFAGYTDSRRVLVLDAHAALRYQSTDWWGRLFSIYRPPIEIGEIWLGICQWVDEGVEGWIFERLY